MNGTDKGTGLDSSMTDLMTSLAVIFILLLVASLNNAQQEAITVREVLIQELKKTLGDYSDRGVRIQSDPGDPLSLLVLIPESLLAFKFGDYQVPAAGVEFLGDFAPRLLGTVCDKRFRGEVNAVVVEGHTDSTGTEIVNLPLSQRRSMEVVVKSLDKLPAANAESAELKACVVGLLSASGRGSGDPILVNGVEDKERSRRVIFKVRVRSLEQRQLVDVVIPEQNRK